MDTTYVALLRGINVGGNNPVPMAGLRAAFEELGAQDVATYIQSGNVVFDGAPTTTPRGSRDSRPISPRASTTTPG